MLNESGCEVRSCAACGKEIVGATYYHVPPVLDIQMGTDSLKTFHPDCAPKPKAPLAPVDHYREALQEAQKLVQEYKLKIERQHHFLVSIYNQANDLESGWTAPVYRDILSNIKRDAKRAIEGA